MIYSLLATGFMLGMFFLIFYTPYLYCKGIFTMEYGTISLKDKITCMLPIINVCKAEHLYTGKVSKVGLSSIVFTFTVILRFVAIYFFTENAILQIITTTIFLVAFLISYIMNVIVIFQILNDSNCFSLSKVLFYSLLFPLGQYYVGKFLPTIIMNIKEVKETFR
ncbi:MAG: hypothetical protein HFI05_00295 [Lachnospiraceae bacterium]|nr:hypothetical protein [Lachnospiraceae bacterium]